MQHLILAFDTATPRPSLAVRLGDAVVERTVAADAGAGRRIAEEIHLLLRDAGHAISDVAKVVVGVGPGGFTGLRIGIATALGLGQALGVPVVGVSSLEALALGIGRVHQEGTLLVPVIDAKRNEVFTGAFRADGHGGLETVLEPRATTAEVWMSELVTLGGAGQAVVMGGDGLGRFGGLPPGVEALAAGHPAHDVNAVVMEEWSRAGGARPVTPLYLRLPDAEVNRQRREAGTTPG